MKDFLKFILIITVSFSLLEIHSFAYYNNETGGRPPEAFIKHRIIISPPDETTTPTPTLPTCGGQPLLLNNVCCHRTDGMDFICPTSKGCCPPGGPYSYCCIPCTTDANCPSGEICISNICQPACPSAQAGTCSTKEGLPCITYLNTPGTCITTRAWNNEPGTEKCICTPYCGNGHIEPPEECDPKLNVEGNGCNDGFCCNNSCECRPCAYARMAPKN